MNYNFYKKLIDDIFRGRNKFILLDFTYILDNYDKTFQVTIYRTGGPIIENGG